MQFLSYDMHSPMLSIKYVVCIANQEIRPCVLKVVAYKRLKTMENYKTVSTKSGCGNLR